jgi:alkylation response protein AidB-like acyl-CoA dehydrogenase
LPTEDEINAIRDGVRSVVTRFRDDDGILSRGFRRAMAEASRFGITASEEYGGAGLGVTEAR